MRRHPDKNCSKPVKPLQISPLGDRAFLAHFASERAAAGWATAVRGQTWPGVSDVVLAYRTVGVFADPDLLDPASLENRLAGIAPAGEFGGSGKLLIVPVLYDGIDLDDVAARLDLSRDAVIQAHAGVDYDVFAIGFLPGYPYAGYLPPVLSGLARRDVPRLRVPAGSVAIAGRQTGIYPRESPAGWHMLGTTPLCIADLETNYFPIAAGDRIRFQPISAAEFEARHHERL
jgi:KipI family sensor histidine kinase inhibitor